MARRFLHALALAGLLTSSPAGAYRDLAACPDLVPLRPPAVREGTARRCQRAVGRAAHRHLAAALAAHHACLVRLQRGAVAGEAGPLCRGAVHLSTGAFAPPEDEATKTALARADGRARRLVERACRAASPHDAGARSGGEIAALGACAEAGSGLAACLERDLVHWRAPGDLRD